MNNAGPIIKYRTAIELLHDDEKRLSLEKDVMASHLVHFWLEKLHATPDRKTLHGAKTENYENVIGKLFEFGLSAREKTWLVSVRCERLMIDYLS